jgi:hypothetical protein
MRKWVVRAALGLGLVLVLAVVVLPWVFFGCPRVRVRRTSPAFPHLAIPTPHPHHQPEYQQISRHSQQVGWLGDAEPVFGVPSRDVGAQERVRIQRMQVSEATLNRLIGVYRARPG